MLSNIRIVLVHTFHPGNIGATARAMKTMGLTQLVLVNPRAFPDEEATRLAAGATDVLDNARCVSTLEDALQDCVQVVGASARLRSMPLPHFDEPDDMAHQVIVNAHQAPVALVFGRERSGLTNDEIRCCTHQVSIPANPDYGILNLSQAVQILAYEVHRAWRRRDDSDFVYQRPLEAAPPSREQFGYFQEHLGRLMHESGFLTQPHARTEEQLQALFSRAQPSRKELSLLRGLLSAFEAHLPKQ
ncbi:MULTISPECIES: RNA methyltransferase [Halomonadaceae]|uniref:tRNA (cytidine/uridine-2'-O-)-methyltransferase TrmJ n=2 Tax=Halomonadaceae TaxID=28256 RepID=A0A1N6CY69_9GAMM|nr:MULTISPECIES: RNA methyltransferase [Halomonas]ATH78997.1 RNA methyltransferase [Halomonas hydrothermalis]MCP1303410.1 RNA methyltransferase [Halomonas sp. R1t8]MCP1330701.1 RNA methyltransferase [Halomonas sp. R1t4]MBV66472.1 RNA methyltransferase [Halomonas sp.]MDM7480545.1 RNA methyltransferase [Halomonas sp.]